MAFVPKIVIASAELVYSGWARLNRYKLDIEKHAGGFMPAVREVHDHGHGASVLPYDVSRGTVLLVRQFRLPPYLGGTDGMMIEACAGLLDGDEPRDCALREAEEELGLRIRDLEAHGRIWGSPGAIAESIWLFLAAYSPEDRIGKGGGKEGEDEDIEILEMTLDEAMQLVATGEIADAKTIILLQHLWIRTQGRPG
ncbi:NUDIX domain-containing protein [Taklimakanibacter lacteus]|uniref:NUDIX domain-containing protein n=1 Tax=Taklimakanibacter lacteus TaxID=2268456 RepID=UPI000E6746E0